MTAKRKAPELDFELYQWFVDEIESWRGRADSALLLKQAEKFRRKLLSQGHADANLPRVTKQWLHGWCDRFEVSQRLTTVRFKISAESCVQRLRTMLANQFRLRTLWQLCHGGDVPMRWASYDQKPSWFNNAGLSLGRNRTSYRRHIYSIPWRIVPAHGTTRVRAGSGITWWDED